MAKGLSLEEKQSRMLDIFYETKDFFALKDIEKIAPKKKDIILQSVKDVLQSLVDDNLVNMEKIGTSNFFWSFPSQQIVQRNNAIRKLSAEKEKLASNIASLKTKLDEERKSRMDKNRESLVSTYEDLLKEKKKLDDDLKKYQSCDPEKYEERKKRLAKLKKEVNKTTDDLFSVQSYVCDKFCIDQKGFCESFDIDEGLDYID